MWFFPHIVNKKKYQSLLFKSALHSALLIFSWENVNSKNSSQYCFKEGKKFFAASTMHLRTYLKKKAVGKSENPGGQVASKVVGIICVQG